MTAAELLKQLSGMSGVSARTMLLAIRTGTGGGLQLVDKFFVVAQDEEIFVVNDDIAGDGYTSLRSDVIVTDDSCDVDVMTFTNKNDVYIMCNGVEFYVISQLSGSTVLEVMP